MAMSAEQRYKNLQPFTGNGDVSIWVKNSRVGRWTPNKQTNKLKGERPQKTATKPAGLNSHKDFLSRHLSPRTCGVGESQLTYSPNLQLLQKNFPCSKILFNKGHLSQLTHALFCWGPHSLGTGLLNFAGNVMHTAKGLFSFSSSEVAEALDQRNPNSFSSPHPMLEPLCNGCFLKSSQGSLSFGLH